MLTSLVSFLSLSLMIGVAANGSLEAPKSCNQLAAMNPVRAAAAMPAADEPDTNPAEEVDRLFYIEGQLCQHLRQIFEDKSGNLWFGTNVYGLMRYDGNSLEYFDESDGLGAGRITGIAEDKNGHLWFGTYDGLTRYDGSTFKNFKSQDPNDNNEIWGLSIDRNGYFWLATQKGVLSFNGESFRSFPVPRAQIEDPDYILSPDRFTCVLMERDGTVWFGTDGSGITLFNGALFEHLTTDDGLSGNTIYDLMEDRHGNIWIGTMFGGISRYDGKTFTNFTLDGQVQGVEAGALYEHPNGDIWFAAENHGVYRYDGKSFVNYNQNNGLNTNGVLCMLQDRQGRFWFGGWGGLFRFDGSNFVSVTKDGPWD